MEERFKVFTVLISNINRYIYKIKTEEMEEFNLKSSHVNCIYYLYKAENLTAKDLCNICKEDKANISRTIKYLEENGYLYRESETDKKYLSIIKLSDKGYKMGKIIASKIDSVLDEASIGLSEEDRQIMYKCLELIEFNLESICEKY